MLISSLGSIQTDFSAILAWATKQSLAGTVLAAKNIFSRNFTIKKARNCSFCTKHRTFQTLFGIEKNAKAGITDKMTTIVRNIVRVLKFYQFFYLSRFIFAFQLNEIYAFRQKISINCLAIFRKDFSFFQ